MVREVIDPTRKYIVVLINDHVVKAPTQYFCLCSQNSSILNVSQRSSFFIIMACG